MQDARRAAQPSMVELVGEIRNSIQYFASLPGRLPVSQVLVTGAGSDLYGLVPMLEAQIQMPVRTVSPLGRLDVSRLDLTEAQADEVGPVLAAPIGLALPEPDKAVKKFNLLPPEVANRARMKRIQERTLMGAAAVLVLLLGFGGWKFLQVHSAQNNVNQLKSSIATLNAQVPKYDLVVAANNAYTAGLTRRASVLNSAVDWPLALGELIAITPAKAEVQSFIGTSNTRNHWRRSVNDAGSVDGPPHDLGGNRHGEPGGERTRPEPVHLRGVDQCHRQVPDLRQPAPGRNDRERQHDLVSVHDLGHPGRQP